MFQLFMKSLLVDIFIVVTSFYDRNLTEWMVFFFVQLAQYAEIYQNSVAQLITIWSHSIFINLLQKAIWMLYSLTVVLFNCLWQCFITCNQTRFIFSDRLVFEPTSGHSRGRHSHPQKLLQFLPRVSKVQ